MTHGSAKSRKLTSSADDDEATMAERQAVSMDGSQRLSTASHPARTTADSVLDTVLKDMTDADSAAAASVAQAQPSSRRIATDSLLSTLPRDVADPSHTPAAPQAEMRSGSRYTTTDRVLDAVLGDVAQPSSAPAASQVQAQPGSRRSTTDSVLQAVLRDIADTSSAPDVHQTHGSRRTTTDSVVDRLLREVGSTAPALSRQHSGGAAPAAAPTSIRHDTADSALSSVVCGRNQSTTPSTSTAVHNAVSRGNSTAEPDAAGASLLNGVAHSGRRPTADSVVDDMLDGDEADRASVDSLLDGVLEEVAGAASRQRTTADSVLDAMLDDLSSSRPGAQAGMASQSPLHHMHQTSQQDQAQGVSPHHACPTWHA